MKRSLLATALALCASPAFAACPTAEDVVKRGVYIDYSDNTFVRYRQIEADVIGEATYVPTEGENFFSGRYLGVYLIIDAALKDDRPDSESLFTFQPASDAPDWPAVAPGMSWEGTMVTRRANGDFVNRFEMRVEVTGEDALHISGCDYTVDILRVEEVHENSESASEQRYIRELGIGYVSAYGPLTGEYEHYYVPRWIGLKPPC